MPDTPSFQARFRSGYTETPGGGLRYEEQASWPLRLFVGFMGLAMWAIPIPFVLHAHLGMPMLHLLLAAVCVIAPAGVGLLFLASASSRPLRVCFDPAKRQVLRTSHWPLGRRDVPFGFEQVDLLDVLQRPSEDGPFHIVRLGLRGQCPMHLGSFDQRADAEHWRHRIEALLRG